VTKLSKYLDGNLHVKSTDLIIMNILNFLKVLCFGLTSASWSDDVQETAEFLIRGKLKIKI